MASTPPDSDGRFLQLSGLAFSWRFQGTDPILSEVFVGVERTPLNDSATISFASNNFIANGGDGYDVLKEAASVTRTGTILFEAVARYLERVAPSAAAPLQLPSGADRVIQLQSERTLYVGLLCDSSALSERETCDHVHHAAQLLNDKSDGFLDSLLPHARIELNETLIGCASGDAPAGLARLRDAMPQMAAVIGPGCSDDVIDVSSMAARASRAAAGVTSNEVFISASSTLTRLSNESFAPNLARLSSTDAYVSTGVARLATIHIGWRRISILHDDTSWALDAASKFTAELESAGGEVLRDVAFREADFASGAVTARSLLEELESASTRVLFVAVSQLSTQRALFATSYRDGLLHGEGYAWLSSYLDEGAFVDDDGDLDIDAARGADGLLGLRESVDTSSVMHQAYLGEWAKRASAAACSVAGDGARAFTTTARADTRYCDIDGEPSGLPVGYSAQAVDALLTCAPPAPTWAHLVTIHGPTYSPAGCGGRSSGRFAHAADALLREQSATLGPVAVDGDALYSQIQSLGPTAGVSGEATDTPPPPPQGRLEAFPLAWRPLEDVAGCREYMQPSPRT